MSKCMKKELSALELHFLVREFQTLVGGRLDKAYQSDKDKLYLQMHITGQGKKVLHVRLPYAIYYEDTKPEVPSVPPHFCAYLRKKLGNASLKGLYQYGFERILVMDFQNKLGDFKLLIELFDKGNAILCDNEWTVLSAIHYKKFRERVIRPNVKYQIPPALPEPWTITFEKAKEIFEANEGKNLAKTLASRFGLGGVYAEEVLYRGGVDKNQKEVSDEDIKRIVAELHKLREIKPEPIVLTENEILKGAFPFKVKDVKEHLEKNSFNDAVKDFMETFREDDKQEKQKNAKVQKQEQMIEKQEEMKQGFEKEIEENMKKGELIYENYQLVEDIISQLRKARENLSWKEIKERLKDHKYVKEIDEKNNAFVIEL